MKLNEKKTILFDLDGTLTDSGEGIVNSFKYTLKCYNIHEYDEKMLNRFIGPPLKDSMKELFCCSDEKAKEAIEKYREYYKTKGIYENRMYDGVEPLLRSLARDGRKVILATSKAEVFAVKILDSFKISQYFMSVAGAELNGTRTGKDEVIRYALEKAGVSDREGVVMVGDREHDILGAKQEGLDSIGVLYGYGNYEELKNAGASAIVETVDDLHKVLLDLS